MTRRIVQQNLKNSLTTAFHIPAKEGCSYVNIDSIRLDNRLAQTDYKTNYFAFLRKNIARLGVQSLVFSYCDRATDMNYYILEIVRVPVKEYKNQAHKLRET